MNMKHGLVPGFAALFIAAIVSLSSIACAPEEESDDPKGPDIPAISEPTTGQPTITITDETLTGDAIDVGLSGNQNGVTWSVASGKLNATFGTPTTTQTVSDWLSDDGQRYFGNTAGANVVTVTGSANIVVVDGFSQRVESNRYSLSRLAYETDNETYGIGSTIVYVYVSADVTLSRGAKTQTETDEYDDRTYTSNYAAFSLALKAGWNLVQTDNDMRSDGTSSFAIKIATNNVPWTASVENRG